MQFKCDTCGDDLETVTFSASNGGVHVWLNNKEEATLYACTSRDCKSRGIVVAIPCTVKEDG